MAIGIPEFATQLAALQAQFAAGDIDQAELAAGLQALWEESENIPLLFQNMQEVIAVKAQILTALQAALNVKGTVPNVSALPADAEDGEAYQLVNANDPADGDLFRRVAGAWVNVGPLRGAKGRSAFEIAVAVAEAAEEEPPADEAAFIQYLRQPAIDAAASADDVREATDQARLDTLDAKEATEAVTEAANLKIAETEDVRAATDQVRLDTIAAKNDAQAVVAAGATILAAKDVAVEAKDDAEFAAAQAAISSNKFFFYETLDLDLIAQNLLALDNDNRRIPPQQDPALTDLLTSANTGSYYETLDLTLNTRVMVKLDADNRVLPDDPDPTLAALAAQAPTLEALIAQAPALADLSAQAPALEALSAQAPALAALSTQAVTGTYYETLDLTINTRVMVKLDADNRVLPDDQDPTLAALAAQAPALAVLATQAMTSEYFETLDSSLGNGLLLDADRRIISSGSFASAADLALLAGSRASPAERLLQYLTPYGTPKTWLRGAHNLRNTRRKLRARLFGDTERLIWAGYGDSYTDGFSYWSQRVTIDQLPNWNGGLAGNSGVGYGGPGWIGFGSSSGLSSGIKGYVAPHLYSCTRAGAGWSDQFGTQIHGPDLCSATSSTAGDSYTITSVSGSNPAIATCKLAYVGGSGAVRYRWNGGSWTALDLSAGAGLQLVALSGVPAGVTWTLDVEVVSGPAVLCGLLPASTVNGLVFHKMAATGRRIQELAATDATSMATALAALSPDLITIGTPINDRQNGRSPTQFYGDLLTHIGRVRSAAPAADILLFCPAEIAAATYSIPMSSYATVMDQVAAEQGCAFIDFQYLFGPDVNGYKNGSPFPLLGSDNTHPAINFGGRLMTDGFMRALTQ